MARDSKRKGEEKKAAKGGKGAAKAAEIGVPPIDKKASRATEKRVKKLERDLDEAAQVEHERVRALDKAHRRRQLVQAALEELGADGSKRVAASSDGAASAPAARVAATAPAPAAKPAAKSAPAAAARAAAPKTAAPKAAAPAARAAAPKTAAPKAAAPAAAKTAAPAAAAAVKAPPRPRAPRRTPTPKA